MRVCIDILILNDGLEEADESFQVLLSSSEDVVVVTTTSARVTITESDRKLFTVTVSIALYPRTALLNF